MATPQLFFHYLEAEWECVYRNVPLCKELDNINISSNSPLKAVKCHEAMSCALTIPETSTDRLTIFNGSDLCLLLLAIVPVVSDVKIEP